MTFKIGFHVSISGGIQNSVLRAQEIGCTGFQIFTRSPRGWAINPKYVGPSTHRMSRINSFFDLSVKIRDTIKNYSKTFTLQVLFQYGLMLSKPIGENESRKMLGYVFLTFGVATVLLVIFLAVSYLHYLSSLQKEFYITFGGDLTFTDESKSTWLIDNRGNSHEKGLLIYWTGNITQGNIPSQIIKSSQLVDQSGKKLDSSDVRFNDSSVFTAVLTHGWNEIRVSLMDNSLSPGSFNGNIILDGIIYDSIPITISTKPLVAYAIILVVIGAVISVCIWEIIRFYKNKILYAEPPEQLKLQGVHEEMYVAELRRQYIRNSNPAVTIPKILVIEFLAVLLGIAVALFGVINSENVTNVNVLGPYQVSVLMGIGLAAGSLKELVDKVEWP